MSEETQKEWVDGFIVKRPHENAPDFIKLNIFIKSKDFYEYMKKHTDERGWLKLDVKKSQKGNIYADLNTFVPKSQDAPSSLQDQKKDEITPEDIPW